jgi:tetratricopeptide (TPR) repeat protein
MRPNRQGGRFAVLWILPLALCCLAAYRSVALAVADYDYAENTLASVRRAVAIAPTNALYHAMMAEHMEGVGLNPDAELQAAIQLSPLDSKYWIRAGFRAEVEHDYPKAERYLLHAAEIDHKFDPRSALMNFYFRRNNVPEFWRWTDKAFELSYSDPTPMFQLMWNVTSDAEEIRKHIPAHADIEIPYLWFLINNQRPDASTEVARDAADKARTDDEATALLGWWEHLYPIDGVSRY